MISVRDAVVVPLQDMSPWLAWYHATAATEIAPLPGLRCSSGNGHQCTRALFEGL